jgi:hypothetical protein
VGGGGHGPHGSLFCGPWVVMSMLYFGTYMSVLMSIPYFGIHARICSKFQYAHERAHTRILDFGIYEGAHENTGFWYIYELDFPKVLSIFFSRFVCTLERTFFTCSAPNLPVDFLTGV